jgi:hypothetical protein
MQAMRTPILNRLFSASPKPLLLAFAVLGSAVSAQAQSTSVSQTFGNTASLDSNLPFTVTNPAGQTGLITGYFSETTGSSGSGAYGIALANNGNGNGGSAQLEFAKTFPAGSGSAADRNRLSFNIASFSNNGSANQNGFGTTTNIAVYVSVAGANFPATPQVQIQGTASIPKYGFNAGTVNPTFDLATNTTYAAYPNTDPNKVNSVTIYLPNAPVGTNSLPTAGLRVVFRIVMSTFDRGTFLIDNVTLTAGNTTQPLPVELTRFNAEVNANGVGLSWATASEKNSAYFEVQRSATGEAYETLGRVAAQGTSNSLREYRFTDTQPLGGLAYYRLRQVDNDGTAAYSPVATARRSIELAAIYPNPTTDGVVLPTSLGPVRYRVLNSLGQALASGQAAGGDRLDLSHLPKGAFFLELTDASGRHTQRLTRQ